VPVVVGDDGPTGDGGEGRRGTGVGALREGEDEQESAGERRRGTVVKSEAREGEPEARSDGGCGNEAAKRGKMRRD